MTLEREGGRTNDATSSAEKNKHTVSSASLAGKLHPLKCTYLLVGFSAFELSSRPAEADIRRAARMSSEKHMSVTSVGGSTLSSLLFRSWLVASFRSRHDEGKNLRISQESRVPRARYGSPLMYQGTAIATAFPYSSRMCLSARSTDRK